MDKTKLAVDIFNKHAQGYQDKFMDVEIYDHTFDIFCEQIKNKNGDILELACGPGNITRYLLKKHPGFKILGTDLAPNMIALAKKNNPTAEFQIMDCRDLFKFPKKFDGIMCGFCLPYLSKEETLKLIEDAALLLKPNGVFYLSTMEDDYSKSGLETTPAGNTLFMHYHEAGYLIDALKKNNFKIIHQERLSSPPQASKQTTDLVIIAVI